MSKVGAFFAVAYVALALPLFFRAATCSGWACDLVALPAAFPLGFLFSWAFDVPNLRTLSLIVPTVIGNALFYFGFGIACEKVFVRLRRR